MIECDLFENPYENEIGTHIWGVRFHHTTGKPRTVQLLAKLVDNETLGKVVQLDGGSTGYESFCLEGTSAANLERMKSGGWWACIGTFGQWDALYIHKFQMRKLFKDLNIEEKTRISN